MKILILTVILHSNLLQSRFDVIKSEQSAVIFQFNGSPDFFQEIEVNGKKLVFLEGTEVLDTSKNSPLIPFFRIPVALDFAGKFTVKMEILEKEEYNLTPVAIPEFKDDGLTSRYSSPQKKGVFPERNLIYTDTTLNYRGVPYAEIHFSPYIYNSSTGILTYIRKARFTISPLKKITAAGLKTDNPFYQILKRNMLNYHGQYVSLKSQSIKQQNPFDEASLWFCAKIREEGVYHITYSDLSKEGLNFTFPVQNIAVYTRGGDTLSGKIEEAYASFKKIPIIVNDNNHNGIFDSGDEIIFYASGPKGLRYNENTKEFYYFKNPYTDTAAYWIGIGASSLPMDTLSITSDTALGNLNALYHYERDLVNIGWKGLLWEGENIVRTSGETEASLSFNFNLEDIASPSGILKIQLVGGYNTSLRKVVVELNKEVLDTITFSYYAIVTYKLQVHNFKESNTLKLTLLPGIEGNTDEDIIYLDYFTCFYNRATSNVEGTFFFTGNDTLNAKISVGTTPLLVLDVSDRFHPQILPLKEENSIYYVEDSVKKGTIIYIARTLKSPERIEIVPRAGELYELPAGINYFVITTRPFISTLVKYETYRENHLLLYNGTSWVETNGKVKIIAVEDIYRDFGFGQLDPVAIRNFLKFYYDHYPEDLVYTVLMGDACYDYKNIGGGGNIVPAYEPVLSADIDDQQGARDDFFADMTGDGFADIFIGRVPVRTKEQLAKFVDKVISYENKDLSGYWRARFILVSDDEYGETNDPVELGLHLPYVDYIRRNLTPEFVQVREVYEVKYGSPADLQERSRESRENFIKTFNQGGLVLTFYGHGNPVQLTHERMLLLQDLPLLKSNGKNPLAMFMSCKVGAFTREDPAFGIAEYMAIEDQAIATIASTISQFVYYNVHYGQEIHSFIEDRKLHSLGEIAQVGKSLSQSLTYYTLFGDPALIFSLPQKDSLTTLSVQDSLKKGNVNLFYYENAIPGELYHVVLLHRPSEITYTTTSGSSYTYLGENMPIFYGSNRIKTLPGTGKFFIPLTADTGSGLCLAATRKENNNLYLSYLYPLTIYEGTPDSTDKKGPAISIFINGKEIEDTALVPLQFNMKLVLEDTSGINLFKIFGTEKGIMLKIDNEFVDLTPFFEYYENSHTKGELTYAMNFELPGEKDMDIIAYDNLNNLSLRKVHLVIEEEGLLLEDVLAYPNPVRKGDAGVYFTFRTNKPSWVEIKVYSIAGRLIWTSGKRYFSEGFGKIFWNLRDNFNDRIASGYYIYKFECKSENGEKFEIKKGLIIAK